MALILVVIVATVWSLQSEVSSRIKSIRAHEEDNRRQTRDSRQQTPQSREQVIFAKVLQEHFDAMGVKPGTLAGLPALSKSSASNPAQTKTFSITGNSWTPLATASEIATGAIAAAAVKSKDSAFVAEKWVGQYDREKLGAGVLDLTPDPFEEDRKYV
jgi:hypothetical protein